MTYPEQPDDLVFTKSPYSSDQQGCVELSFVDNGVWLRDSKKPDRPALYFTNHEWECLEKWRADARG